jgi:hypothetical protein
LASRRLRVLVDLALRELGERFVGFLFLAERVLRSFTAWFRPSSDIVCHRRAADQLKQHHRVKRGKYLVRDFPAVIFEQQEQKTRS